MTYEEYLSIISNDTSYPRVVTTSEPLMVRVDQLSLLVNNTNFYAKIKNGLAWCGYMIYASGSSMPICENQVENSSIKKDANGNVYRTNNEQVESSLKQSAQQWLDKLEAKIATTNADNGIKKAIDRLNWQLHYDITKTNTSDAYAIAEYDLSDGIKIDRPIPYTGTGTQPTTEVGYSVVDTVGVLLNGQLLEDTTSLTTSIQTQTRYFVGCLCYEGNVSIYNPEQQSTSITMSKGLLNLIEDDIVTVGSNIDSLDTNLNNGTYGSLTSLINTTNKVATNIKGDNDAYTISTALRVGNEASVSGATQAQTNAEIAQFTDIEGRLGDPSSSSTTIWDTVNIINGNIGAPISGAPNTLFSVLGSSADGDSNTNTGTLFYEVLHRAGTRSLNSAQVQVDSPISTITSKIGNSGTSGTLWYDVLHNSGIYASTASVDTNSLQGKVNNINSVLGDVDSTNWTAMNYLYYIYDEVSQ